jgi:hypothetical protein
VNGKDDVVIDKPLYDTIDLQASKVSIKKTKVEIMLSKVSPLIWPQIEGDGTPASAGAFVSPQ